MDRLTAQNAISTCPHELEETPTGQVAWCFPCTLTLCNKIEDLERQLAEARARAVPLPSEHYTDKILELEAAVRALTARAAAWQETAARENRGVVYYRSIVVEIGNLFGDEARIADDGSLAEAVLCAKVAEVVSTRLRTLTAQAAAMRSLLDRVRLAEDPEEYLDDLNSMLDSPDSSSALLRMVEAAIKSDALTWNAGDACEYAEVSLELRDALAALRREPGWGP